MSANRYGFIAFLLAIAVAFYIQGWQEPVWKEQRFLYETVTDEAGNHFYLEDGEKHQIDTLVDYADSPLNQASLDNNSESRPDSQWVKDGENIVQLKPGFHFGIWSLLPAFIAIILCLTTREPIAALLGGVIVAGVMLGRFDITDDILLNSLASDSAAYIVLLYLWLLGGLLGVWSKTGAAQAFASFMTEHFVRGPKSAKFVTWLLGVVFFQGGTVSTVLVGTTVKPLADKAGVSHEELSYIVDSTASPIALVLAFNAWPAYVQALIFVPGVAFLATDEARINFFFSSIPFSFYGVLAVIGTLLLCFNITWHTGGHMRKAHRRAAETGQLDEPGAKPMSAKELHEPKIPKGFSPSALEFVVPMILLIAIAVLTFVFLGTPKVNWAFGVALVVASAMAMWRGLTLDDLMDGLGNGFKGVVVASVVLVLAVTLGSLSKQTGGGLYLVELLGERIPFWVLPVCLQLITMVIAFSTGTSWGTYAIAFPLAMPLAWVVADHNALQGAEVFMMICFAAVLNGSVYGDQCSPISDTTILSSMTTGCDMMDHVKTQIVPATMTAALAGVLWTLCALIFT